MKTKQEHTPEPWTFDGLGIVGKCGEEVTLKSFPIQNEANRKRIIFCVNALAGIENPAEYVEKAKEDAKISEEREGAIFRLQQRIKRQAEAVKELVEAAKEAMRLMENMTGNWPIQTVEKLRAALKPFEKKP